MKFWRAELWDNLCKHKFAKKIENELILGSRTSWIWHWICACENAKLHRERSHFHVVDWDNMFYTFFFFLIDYNPLQQFICNNCCIPSFILVSFKIDVLKKVNLTVIFNYYNFSIFFPCAQNITSHDLPAEKHAIACRCVHIVFHINLFAF